MAVPFGYPTNITDFTGIINYSNTISEGFLGVGILLMTFVITFVLGKNYSTDKALGFSGFITFLIGLLLRASGLINNTTMNILIFMIVGIIVYVWFLSKKEEI